MGNQACLLIVDDDPNLRKTLSDILTLKGHRPCEAGTGRDALAVAKAEKPAVVLLDLRLEDMSGLEVMERIKRLSPTTECIVLTGYASQSSAIEAINLGAYSYVQKPYEIEHLLVTIQRAVEKQEAEIERQQLLVQLQEQTRRMQQTIDAVPEGVVLLDGDGRVALANPIAEEYVQLLAGAGKGDRVEHLADCSLKDLLERPLVGLWHTLELEGQLPRSFEAAARPIDLEKADEGWVMVIREVTREREIQQRAQQQERLAAVGQLAAGIAHDFNNIMAVIILYAQLGLRGADLPDKLRERLETMERQARRATELIEQILDFGRRSVLERQPMDLAPFMKEQVKMLERTLPESIRIELRLIGRPAEYRVSADPTRIQQVIMNLAVNARDAMAQAGSGRLQIGLKQVRLNADNGIGAEAGDWVVATVSDTGAGIPPEVQAHIFEPFFTTKGPGEGSGLGLAQVYGIVKQHQGHIEVASLPGKGTTFTFYLPALPVVQPEVETHGEQPLVYGQGELILVVEDDETVRAALVSGLTMMNYRIIEAGNGRQALEILAERGGEIDLVLSDLVMPELGGRGLLKQLAENGTPYKVILMTGYPLGEEVVELSDQGMFDWFRKPVDLNRLSQVVHEALQDEGAPAAEGHAPRPAIVGRQ